MSRFTDWIERRRGTLAGGALGIVLSFAFLGQTYREVQRFSVDPNSPPATACLGLTQEECVARVVESGSTPPDRNELESTRRANQIGNRQRARARARQRTSTSRGSSSPTPSQSSTSPPGGSSRPPSPPSESTPNSPPRRPRSPSTTGSSPSPQPTTPRQPTPTPSSPAPTPTPTTPPPTTSTPPPTTPTVPRPPRPPINIPVPPIPPIIPTPPSICTPIGGINCPPGSVQGKRLSGRGPGNDEDPVRPGYSPDSYDIDPTQPSDHVNPVPTRG